MAPNGLLQQKNELQFKNLENIKYLVQRVVMAKGHR